MKCVLVLSVFCVFLASADAQMPGGLGAKQVATAEVQGYADKLRREIEKSAGVVKFKQFKVVEFKSQVVAGINFFMKIKVGNKAFIHAKIFKPISGSVTLSSLQMKKSRRDSIEYF